VEASDPQLCRSRQVGDLADLAVAVAAALLDPDAQWQFVRGPVERLQPRSA
jgi:hypothetical protein